MSPVIEGGEGRSGGGASAIGKRLIDAIRKDDVSGLSAEIAYRFLFAIFPFGLFVAALGAFVATSLHIANPAEEIVAGLGDNLPSSIADALRPELERLLSTARADLLAFGALAALWAATGGTNALVKGIHRAYDVPEQRPFLLRYVAAVGLTLLAAVGLIGSFVTIVGGAMLTQQLADRIGLGDQAFAVMQLLRWPAVFLVLTAAVAILYRYAPSIVVPWRWIAVGAAGFTVGWIVATAALGFYVANVANYGVTYGSLGAVIVLMLWFYVTAAMLILGAELTAAITRERSPSEIRRRGEELAAAEAIEGAADGATRRVKDVAERPAG
ncbi:MAG TPA: YihY/virulence factor BrkB family protein [Candidatus Limnocylindrales bacterium]|nr:YihY/virulence factor BrkB family protein [Candidatus Limnocylindrales bacterium]